jgi:hypothetical protein
MRFFSRNSTCFGLIPFVAVIERAPFNARISHSCRVIETVQRKRLMAGDTAGGFP